MSGTIYLSTTRELAQKRRELGSETEDAFQAFDQNVFASVRVKQLIAVAVAYVAQCPCCIKGHIKAALRHGVASQDGRHLDRCQNASGRRLCTFGPRARGNGESRPGQMRVGSSKSSRLIAMPEIDPMWPMSGWSMSGPALGYRRMS